MSLLAPLALPTVDCFAKAAMGKWETLRCGLQGGVPPQAACQTMQIPTKSPQPKGSLRAQRRQSTRRTAAARMNGVARAGASLHGLAPETEYLNFHDLVQGGALSSL